MSNKLFPVSRRELIRRLAKLGFDGPYVGSGHEYIVKANIRITIQNPHYGKDIGIGLLTQILKEAGISR
ncbi:MAG: type II toxin-antitoxin system HicA family toxin [Methanotrichaceae archaeon]|nr:type II toxin-antitoxin system HicA family toxin [Methanotrichaceae archaeon]